MRVRAWAGTVVAVAAGVAGAAPGAAADELEDYAAVRGDFQPDRVITACRFTVEQLENARAAMTGEDEYSGLQGAIGAEIVRHRTGGCPGGGGVEGRPVVSRAGFRPAAVRRGRVARLRFGLSRRAAVRVTVQRRRGRRWVRVRRLVRSNRRPGTHVLPLRTRGLRPGLYRATVVALAARRASVPRRALLRIRR